jgi:phosphopantetheinyl transferase
VTAIAPQAEPEGLIDGRVTAMAPQAGGSPRALGRARPGASLWLKQGDVHVWQADLDALIELDRASGRLAALLDGSERERARRIVRPQAARRWVAARAFVRRLLGAYLQADPAGLRFGLETRGKPALAGAHAGALRFNLSHSGPVALCAVTRMWAVGVDVQLPGRRRRDAVAIARRAFGEEHSLTLLALPAKAREARLLSMWASFEAHHKRLGDGIWAAREPIGEPRPWTGRLDPGMGGAAAVALARPPARFGVGRWLP